MKIENKVAIIAGGGQGIGEGCARCLAEEGADIAVVDVNGDNANKVADDIKKMGRKALAIVADLTREDEVNRSVKEAVDFFGKIDILVNNVGGVSLEMSKMQQEQMASFGDESLPSYMQFSPDVWDKYYQLNLKSHVMMSHAVTPVFQKQKSGRIINISSIAARMGGPDQMPYNAFKAGDISITWSLARALAQYNVTVNCICPGHVFTPLWERGAIAMLEATREAKTKGLPLPARLRRYQPEELDTEGLTPHEFWLKYMIAPMTPLGRDQTAEDMGKAVLFFASDDAKNVSGQTIHVDGGVVMR